MLSDYQNKFLWMSVLLFLHVPHYYTHYLYNQKNYFQVPLPYKPYFYILAKKVSPLQKFSLEVTSRILFGLFVSEDIESKDWSLV